MLVEANNRWIRVIPGRAFTGREIVKSKTMYSSIPWILSCCSTALHVQTVPYVPPGDHDPLEVRGPIPSVQQEVNRPAAFGVCSNCELWEQHSMFMKYSY